MSDLSVEALKQVDLVAFLRRAGEEQLTSVLIEGWQKVFNSVLKAEMVDKLLIFLAPCLLGNGKESFGDLGVRRMADALQIREFQSRRVGADLLVTGRL